MARLEPLDLKNLWNWFEKKFGANAVNRYYGYETNELIKEIRRRIKSACEFYLKYFDMPYKLKKDYPEIADEVDEIITETVEMTPEEDGWSYYNKWLFKLAFKDVLGDEE